MTIEEATMGAMILVLGLLVGCLLFPMSPDETAAKPFTVK